MLDHQTQQSSCKINKISDKLENVILVFLHKGREVNINIVDVIDFPTSIYELIIKYYNTNLANDAILVNINFCEIMQANQGQINQEQNIGLYAQNIQNTQNQQQIGLCTQDKSPILVDVSTIVNQEYLMYLLQQVQNMFVVQSNIQANNQSNPQNNCIKYYKITLEIVTQDYDRNKFGLEVIRHSTAHLLAHAVISLYPNAQITIGPVIDNGFYYDFDLSNNHEKTTFSVDDLPIIEKKMKELAEKNTEVRRFCMLHEDAIKYFNTLGQSYKAEIITDIVHHQALKCKQDQSSNNNIDSQISKDLSDKNYFNDQWLTSIDHQGRLFITEHKVSNSQGAILSLYQQDNFVDLCRGPHVLSTRHLKHFRLTKCSASHWRGDQNGKSLQRIYGTAWHTKKDLVDYINLLAEAEARDHRKLAKQMDLFHIQDEAPGMIFWHENGWVIWQIIEQYIRSMYKKYGYREVKTPQIVDRVLWEDSGHWEKFKDDMFALTTEDGKHYAIKPMNCPCHVQIYKQGLKSYNDLPIRLAEFGACHRNEASGALYGLMRVRGFTQDDGHIFCTENQIQDEISLFIAMLFEIYQKFGFSYQNGDVLIKLSTRPKARIGSDEMWDRAEHALGASIMKEGLEYEVMHGEGAFYGPKIEFVLKDAIGRLWTTGSVQLDFSMPERLGAYFIDSDSKKQTPVMLHRAICGSIERFIGILIEHYAGILPLWIAPVQVAVLNVSDAQIDYAKQVYQYLFDNACRAILDIENQKLGYKIRLHTLNKIPYLILIGDNEVSNNTVSLRKRDGTNINNITQDECLTLLKQI